MKTHNFQGLLLIFASCASITLVTSCVVTTPTSNKNSPDVVGGYAENTNFGIPIQTPLGMSVDKHTQLDGYYFTSKKYDAIGFNRWLDVAARANDWHSPDQLGRAVVKGVENDPLEFHIAQWISYSMLRGFLLKQDPTREVKEAVAYHLNILHKYNSFRDAKVIFQSLERLQGFWTDEQISKFSDDVFQFRELKQQIASKTKIPNAEERLRQRAKKMIQDTPQFYSGADAEEKLVQKLKRDREEAQNKLDPSVLRDATLKAMQEEQEESTFTEKLKQLAKRR
ncbi:MAG: hypothetical protein H9535_03115 [Ignavibacteria bacterium]|nr:hypothetical protein [Ignavibacteria bacterium]